MIRVYISHASEDQAVARNLFHRLKQDGLDPWLDEYSFGPGQREPQIEPAIESSNIFVFLVSRASTGRPGLYNDEIKFALKMTREGLDGAPTIVPLRLDDSEAPANLKDYLSYDLYPTPTPPQGSSDAIDTAGYDHFKEGISKLTQKTSRYVFSLHGIKTRGVWQKEVTPLLAMARFIPDPRDFGNVWALQLLWPPSRRKKVERFVKDYAEECDRLRSGTPSIVAHSYGTYIAGEAMLKYPEIKFDRMILCGAILQPNFPWDDLAKNGQVNAVLNQYGGQDFWAGVVAWVVADAGPSGRYGFSSRAACLTQQKYPRFQHSDYFHDLNYTQNWLPFLKGEKPAPPPIEGAEETNWRFRATSIILLVFATALALYFLRGRTLFPFKDGAQSRTKAYEYAASGATKINDQHYTEAIRDLDEALRLEPSNAEWYDKRGIAYTYLQQYEPAIQNYNRAIELSSGEAGYYNDRGWSRTESGHPELAIPDLNKAIQLDPRLQIAYANRCVAFLARRDLQFAMADCNSAIEIDPTREAYEVRAKVKRASGDQAGADADMRRAAHLAASNP